MLKASGSAFDIPTRKALTKQLEDGLLAVRTSRLKRKAEIIKLIEGVLYPLERQALKDPKPKPKVDPVARAASLFKAAQNLEKAGKAKAAREFYRRIVTDFPGTPEAEKAKAKVDDEQREPQARRAPAAARHPSFSIPGSGSSSYSLPFSGGSSFSMPSDLCGAPTRDGTPCMRRVAGGGYCYQHR